MVIQTLGIVTGWNSGRTINSKVRDSKPDAGCHFHMAPMV